MKILNIILKPFILIAITVQTAFAEFNLVGPDGKPISGGGVDAAKVDAGVGEVMLAGGIVFGAVLAVSLMIMAIAMILGKRQWVSDHLLNIGGGILLFAFGAGAAAAIIAKVS